MSSEDSSYRRAFVAIAIFFVVVFVIVLIISVIYLGVGFGGGGGGGGGMPGTQPLIPLIPPPVPPPGTQYMLVTNIAGRTMYASVYNNLLLLISTRPSEGFTGADGEQLLFRGMPFSFLATTGSVTQEYSTPSTPVVIKPRGDGTYTIGTRVGCNVYTYVIAGTTFYLYMYTTTTVKPDGRGGVTYEFCGSRILRSNASTPIEVVFTKIV